MGVWPAVVRCVQPEAAHLSDAGVIVVLYGEAIAGVIGFIDI